MGPRDVGGILQRGGTILRTARSMEFKTPEGQRKAIRLINNAGIDALVILGGDGSLNGGDRAGRTRACRWWACRPRIDNDIFGTDMCIGVDTALNTIVDAIDKLRDTASSHNRAFLVETMGRHCGYLAVQAGIVTGAEMVLIPEVETPFEEIATAVDDAYKRGKTALHHRGGGRRQAKRHRDCAEDRGDEPGLQHARHRPGARAARRQTHRF